MSRYPALFALILFVLSIIINFFLQPNMFAKETLNSNMRVFLPIILMSVGQAIVILGGGIDISVGSIVSIVRCPTRVGLAGSPEKMWQLYLCPCSPV
jgi:ribose transport system permease protein